MDTITTLFPISWQHHLLGGPMIGSGVALLFVLTGLVGGRGSVFGLRTKP
jgi:hypothetical protein